MCRANAVHLPLPLDSLSTDAAYCLLWQEVSYFLWLYLLWLYLLWLFTYCGSTYYGSIYDGSLYTVALLTMALLTMAGLLPRAQHRQLPYGDERPFLPRQGDRYTYYGDRYTYYGDHYTYHGYTSSTTWSRT